MLRQVNQYLSGNRTYIGAILLSLLGAVSTLDLMLHDGHYQWFSGSLYASIGAIVGGATGVALRASVGKTITLPQLAQIAIGLLQNTPAMDELLERQKRMQAPVDANQAADALKLFEAAGDSENAQPRT